jgi:hypothetical protein
MSYTLENCTPTSTGNELAYWDGECEIPTWRHPIGPESLEDIRHAEALQIDREQFPNVHIHWEESSRDCDGGHGDHGIYWGRDDDRFIDAESGEIDAFGFWSFHVHWLSSPCAIDGTMRVQSDPYSQFDYQAEWSESTEEGYRHREIYMCTDECETPRNTVYDQYAEMMGY